MIRSLLSVLAFVSMSTSAFSQAAEQPDILQLEGVAALVNDEPISFFDVRQRAQMLMVTLSVQPSPEVLQQLLGNALEQLIDEKLQLQAAEEIELEVSKDRMENSLNRIAEQSGSSMEQLTEEFNRAGISMSTLENQIRADIGWQDMMRGRFGRNIRISKARIDRQMDVFRTDSKRTSYQLAEIFLYAPSDEEKLQAQTAAITLIEQLQAGTPFRSMAQQISSAPTAAAGGDMGWVAHEDLDPNIAAVVTKAQGPGILEPIVAEDGVYIIALRAKREPQEEVSLLSLMQIVASDNDIETLEAAMDDIDSCDAVKSVADRNNNIIMADLGTVNIVDLAPAPQQLLTDVAAGELTIPFESPRGWSSIAVCSRKDGAQNLPSDDQIENQLYGRELNMISDRELRNARLEATIVR